MESSTLHWLIGRAFDSIDRRARVVERLIADHRSEFGENTREPSIDAICISMVSLAAMAKYRFESVTGRAPEQFRSLLNHYAPASFVDRVSVPEMTQFYSSTFPSTFLASVRRSFSQGLPASMYSPSSDPTVVEFLEWMRNAGIAEPRELWRVFHSSLIYAKYRNPVLHGLRIADGDEPYNMWFGQPEVYYSNRHLPHGAPDEQGRLFGVTDRYLLRVLQEVSVRLREWCLREERWIFG